MSCGCTRREVQGTQARWSALKRCVSIGLFPHPFPGLWRHLRCSQGRGNCPPERETQANLTPLRLRLCWSGRGGVGSHSHFRGVEPPTRKDVFGRGNKRGEQRPGVGVCVLNVGLGFPSPLHSSLGGFFCRGVGGLWELFPASRQAQCNLQRPGLAHAGNGIPANRSCQSLHGPSVGQQSMRKISRICTRPRVSRQNHVFWDLASRPSSQEDGQIVKPSYSFYFLSFSLTSILVSPPETTPFFVS